MGLPVAYMFWVCEKTVPAMERSFLPRDLVLSEVRLGAAHYRATNQVKIKFATTLANTAKAKSRNSFATFNTSFSAERRAAKIV